MSTPRDLVIAAERAFEDAGLNFGHGTATARDEAVFLVFHPLGLAFDCDESQLDQRLSSAQIETVRTLIDARIATRKPASYLTNVMWFGGLEFYVDERVLVPRSPLAELILNDFQPWRGDLVPQRILEVGTGSGCIACLMAKAFPEATIIATDISRDALAVADKNVRRHQLETQIELIACDVFPDTQQPFDLIVSNPPYVPEQTVDSLPHEYQAEPSLGLKGGPDGMEIVGRIVEGAAPRLNPGGILILEVGEQTPEFESRYPNLEVTWVELMNGGEGVMVVHRDALVAASDEY